MTGAYGERLTVLFTESSPNFGRVDFPNALLTIPKYVKLRELERKGS